MQSSSMDKNDFFSYGYEKIGNRWDIKYEDLVVQIVETSQNSNDLEKFRELILDAKNVFALMLFGIIAMLIIFTALLTIRFMKKQIKPITKNSYLFLGFIFSILFLLNGIELMGHIRAIEYVFFNFPESPPYPK